MPKQKGAKKTGGRVAGTPNKATATQKQAVAALIEEYQNSGLMSKDFRALDPKDRLVIAERLMQYTMPKMQATQAEITTTNETPIYETLAKLAGLTE